MMQMNANILMAFLTTSWKKGQHQEWNNKKNAKLKYQKD
jgi:hypothetical protein